MGKEAIKVPADVTTQEIIFGNAKVYVSIPTKDVANLKTFAGSISSYSPPAFHLADCPTPQADGSVEKVKVALVLRLMNNKVPKDANKVVSNNTI